METESSETHSPASKWVSKPLPRFPGCPFLLPTWAARDPLLGEPPLNLPRWQLCSIC